MRSKVWKLNNITECFVLRCQRAYVLREVILKMLQNRTVFVISSFVSNKGCKCHFIFMIGVPVSKKVSNLCCRKSKPYVKKQSNIIFIKFPFQEADIS